jgi:hypothetical protein
MTNEYRNPMDVPHISAFACGHIWYSDIPGERIKGKWANWISLQKETEEYGEMTMKEVTLSSGRCDQCNRRAPLPGSGPYFPGGLKVIVSMLEDSLRVLGDKTGALVQKAQEAVQLLARLSKAYPWCQAMKPCHNDMWHFVVFAATLVGLAIREVESIIRTNKRSKKPKFVYVEGQPYNLNALRGGSHRFSQGTVDRQLSAVLPPRFPQRQPQPARLTRVTASMNFPIDYWRVQHSAIALLTSQTKVRKASTVEAQQYVGSVEDEEPEPDEDDVIAFTTTFHQVAELAPENRLVSYFTEWRDNWPCDFCGTDCFCRNLPE